MNHITAPVIDYQGLAPLFAIAGGSIVVILVSLLRSRWVHRTLIPVLTIVALGVCPQIVLSKLDSPKGDKAAKVVAER